MSYRIQFALLLACVFASTIPTLAHARGGGGGFGGGFHGGGGGFGGGFGGAGDFRGAGGFGGAGEFGGAGDFRGAGGYGGAGLDRGGLGGDGLGAGGDLGRDGLGGYGGVGGDLGGAGLGRDGLGAGGAADGLGRDGLGGDALGRDGLGTGGLGADGRFGAGGFGGAAPSRSELNSFLGLPSDEGLHSLSISNPYVHGGGANLGDVNAAHGVVEGPRGGIAAGGAVEGPRGGEAAHGVVVGPDGRVAAGGAARGPDGGAAARGVVAGPHGYAAGFARVSPSDRYFTAAGVRGSYHDWNTFDRGWYTNHPGAWFAAGWAAGRCWWPCTWATVDDWFALTDDEPYYYDYGNTVVYQDDNVYVNNQDAGTAEQYYNQAATLAQTGTQADASSDGDWLPLGVFALSKDGSQSSNMVLQLAVNKQGIIRGNYQDSADSDNQVIHGSVDLKTQRVAFTIGDKTDRVVETGLYNLTKDEAPALIHFGADRTEQWLLVRLTNPNATPATAGTGSDNSAAPASNVVPVDEPN